MKENIKTIEVKLSLTNANDKIADQLKSRFDNNGIWVLNLISSPGAGKTSLIEKSIEILKSDFSIIVIEGDPYTSIDSDRVNAVGGVRGIQINTWGGCHLDAGMIEDALNGIKLNQIDIIIIENVGNLLCPAVWNLGQDNTAVVISLTEGSDKPLKYPEAFIRADTLVINKIDLKPYLPENTNLLKPNALNINSSLRIFEISCLNELGLIDWYQWVKSQINKKRIGKINKFV